MERERRERAIAMRLAAAGFQPKPWQQQPEFGFQPMQFQDPATQQRQPLLDTGQTLGLFPCKPATAIRKCKVLPSLQALPLRQRFPRNPSQRIARAVIAKAAEILSTWIRRCLTVMGR